MVLGLDVRDVGQVGCARCFNERHHWNAGASTKEYRRSKRACRLAANKVTRAAADRPGSPRATLQDLRMREIAKAPQRGLILRAQ